MDLSDIVSDSDDSVFSNDPDDFILGLSTSLTEIGKGTTKYLNYTNDYVWDWGCDEAFRESYQNWRDGILRSAGLALSEFKTTYSEKNRVVLVEARHPNTKELLGFIRLQSDKDGYAVGGLKMANFNVSLDYSALGTGATSKANDPGQTGHHGEGMKLSALVYRRNHYNFRIESSGFKWNFIYKRGELACRLSRMGDKSLAKGKSKAEAEGPLRIPVARPWEDVCVVIGAPGPARTINGRKMAGIRVHVDTFKKWLKVTLDINPPQKMISTNQGDLIRDPRYQSHMYLHGLLLPSGGTSGKEYAYGYNFISGNTTRDRDSLAGAGQESKRIASIWAASIRADDSEDSDILTEYTSLLLNHLNMKGDTILSAEKNCLSQDIAEKVWSKMLMMNQNAQGLPAFYYCASEGKDDVQIIEQSFRMNPVPLHQEMWDMLKKYHLCRTPADELLHRFKFAQAVPVPNNIFATHVHRMLDNLLQSTQDLKGMRLTFVDGQNLQMDAGLFADTWRIHNKWLTFEGAHEHTFCEAPDLEEGGPFSCDHAVLQLWDIVLAQLIATGEYPRIVVDQAWLKSMARGRLAQMPRLVECMTTDKKGELLVTWKSADSFQHRDKEVKVVLHVETCVEAQSQKILGPLSDYERACSCPSQVSKAINDGITFVDLNLDQKYLPSVSRCTEGAFFALQPSSIGSRTENLVITPEPEATPAIVISSSTVGDKHNTNSKYYAYVEDDSDGNEASYQASLRSVSPASNVTAATTPADNMNNIDPLPSEPQGNEFARNTPANPREAASPSGTSMRITVVPREETFVLGPKLDEKSLARIDTLPTSHDFYRTSNAPNEDVFILKPKVEQVTGNKRMRHSEVGSRTVRPKLGPAWEPPTC